jgi:hypothetical protein
VSEWRKKKIQYLRIYLGHPIPGEYKYGDLALQVWRISNSRL